MVLHAGTIGSGRRTSRDNADSWPSPIQNAFSISPRDHCHTLPLENSQENTSKFEPYSAVLKDHVWIVQGTIPPGFHGEILETTVCESDGSVSVNGVMK